MILFLFSGNFIRGGAIFDYMSDLIEWILHMTVGAFISAINVGTSQIKANIQNTNSQLSGIANNADNATKQKIELIIGSLNRVSISIDPLMDYFNRILPSLTS